MIMFSCRANPTCLSALSTNMEVNIQIPMSMYLSSCRASVRVRRIHLICIDIATIYFISSPSRGGLNAFVSIELSQNSSSLSCQIMNASQIVVETILSKFRLPHSLTSQFGNHRCKIVCVHSCTYCASRSRPNLPHPFLASCHRPSKMNNEERTLESFQTLPLCSRIPAKRDIFCHILFLPFLFVPRQSRAQ